MPTLVPANPLEHGLENLRSGLMEFSDFLPTLIYAEIVAPSASEPQASGEGFTPLLYEKNGVDLIAAFSSGDRSRTVADVVPHYLVIQGGELIRRIPAGFGIIINPGWSLGIELSPSAIREIVDAMAEPIFGESS